MGNLDNLGVIVVVLLLAGVIVVSFVVDPDEGQTAPDKSTQVADAGSGGKAAPDPWAPQNASALEALRNNRPFENRRGGRFIDTNPARKPAGRKTVDRGRPGPGPGSATHRPVTSGKQGSRFKKPAGTEGPAKPERSVRGGSAPAGGKDKPSRSTKRPPAGGKRGTRPGKSPHRQDSSGLKNAAAGFPRTVTLKEGESIWNLAVREYGPRIGAGMVDRILLENRIRNPKGLRAGHRVRLPPPPRRGQRNSPARGGARAGRGTRVPGRTRSRRDPHLPFAPDPQEFTPGSSGASGSAGPRWYVVQPGDSLSEIALRELGSAGRVGELKRLNGIVNEDRIQAGVRLRLPVKGGGR